MAEHLQWIFGSTLSRLFLYGVFALPALALFGYFGALGKRSHKRDESADREPVE
ncbi:hypothetical protein [Viridibacterium curvum]|uniref:hypothetical protein n=1 Tax=Viridibacterium curvum TaxID=1101404 RepID=UPI0031F13B98